jgi:transcription termination factor Rho
MDLTSLASKDKDSLATIAKTLGVTSISKMKKSELIEAITAAQSGGDSNEKPAGGIRSRRASQIGADTIDALAAEQEGIASDDGTEFEPRPMRRRSSNSESSGSTSESSSHSAEVASGKFSDSSDVESKNSNSRNASSNNSRNNNDRNNNDDDDNNSRRRRRRGAKGEGGNDNYSSREAVEPIACQGLIEIREDGYGFLRCGGYLPNKGDAYVSAQMIRRNFLRKGDHIVGMMRPGSEDDRKPTPLLEISLVNGQPVEEAKNRRKFEDLTPLFPDEVLKMQLDADPLAITGRIIDLVSPIGKGSTWSNCFTSKSW